MHRTLLLLATLLLLPAPPAGALTRIGSLDGRHASVGVALARDHAYWVDTVVGLHVADLTDPGAPREVATLEMPRNSLDVEVAGTIAFVAADSALQIVDIAEPTAPRTLASFVPTGPPELRDVAVSGSLAYVATGHGLRIVDVSDPSAPVEIGAFDGEGFASHVEVRDDTAYLAATRTGLHILDVSDPAAPTETALVPLDAAEAVAVSDERAYLFDRDALHVFDVSIRNAPRLVDSLEFPDVDFASDIEIDGAFAYLATRDAGLVVVDVASPALRELGRLFTNGRVSDVAIARGRAVVADLNGISVIDLSEPAFPSTVGRAMLGALQDDAEAVAVTDGIALVGHDAFVQILDVSDPTAPAELARFGGFESDPIPLDLVGNVGYVRSDDGFFLLDVSDPTQPHLLARTTTPTQGAAVSEGRAYAVSGVDRTLDVIDVSDPSSPTILSTFRDLVSPESVTVHGGVAYVGDIFGLLLLDVRDPRAPEILATVELGSDAIDVALVGTRAFVAVHHFAFPIRSRLYVIDVSDPRAPVPLSFVELEESSHAVDAIPGRVFVATDEGVRIFSHSEADELFDLGAYSTGAATWDLDREGGLLYVGNAGNGLPIVDMGPEHGATAAIDVRPRGGRNHLDPEGRARVPVAVLGSPLLDATAIDPKSLAFGPAGAPPELPTRLQDVDRDGHLDLVAQFREGAAGLPPDAEEACLSGQLFDRTRFHGCDSIETRHRSRGSM